MGNVTVVLLNNDYFHDLEKRPSDFFSKMRGAMLDPMWDRRPEHARTHGFEVAQYQHSSESTFWTNWGTRLQMMSAYSIERTIVNGDDPQLPNFSPVTDNHLGHLKQLAEKMQREAADILALIEKTEKDRVSSDAKTD